MQHFPLLGSVFRSVPRKSIDDPNLDYGRMLLKSGLVNRDSIKRCTTRQNPRQMPILAPTPRSSVITSLNTRSKLSHIPALKDPEIEQPHIDDLIESIPKTSYADSRIQSETPTIAPNVFYRNYIGKTAPPSSSNFIQLQEMLDRLLSQNQDMDLLEKNEVFDSIFAEVIRQYFIECSPQGRVLDKCRLFFDSICKYIPQLSKKYQDQLNNLENQINSNNEKSNAIMEESAQLQEQIDKLQSIINESKGDSKLLRDHFENLNRSVIQTTKDVEDLNAASLKIEARITEKNHNLISLNEELRKLDEAAAKSTSETIAVADQVKDLLSIKMNIQAQLEAEQQQIKDKQILMTELSNEVDALKKKINDNSKIAPTRDSEAQVDLVIKTHRGGAFEAAKLKRIKSKKKIDPIDKMFDNLKIQTDANNIIPEGGITISTYEDFSRLKNMIIENSNLFQISQQTVKDAEEGNFQIKDSQSDFLRLFSSKIVSDAIDTATRKSPLSEIGTQTIVETMEQTAPISEHYSSVPSALLTSTTKSISQSNLTKLIPVDYSQRNPKSLGWIVKTIRMIYDEKLQQDLKALEKREKLQNLAGFVMDFARRTHDLDFIAYQFAWDIQITTDAYTEDNLEVLMFSNALFEKIEIDQLAFCLIARDYVMKVGAVVSVKTEDPNEQMTEFYLSQDQLDLALHKWWKDRYTDRLFPRLMELAIARPAVHLEATKRYISLTDIMYVMADEFIRDKVDQMSDLLLHTRIVPRISSDKFARLVRKLIPSVTKADLDRFYRATVTKSVSDRREITASDFIEEFKERSILFALDEQSEVDLKMDELLETVRDQFARRREQFERIIQKGEHEAQKDHNMSLSTRTMVMDCRRFLSMTEHSLSIRNASEACFNYFHLIFSIDLLIGSQAVDSPPEEGTLISLECCIKEYWFDSVFDANQ